MSNGSDNFTHQELIVPYPLSYLHRKKLKTIARDEIFTNHNLTEGRLMADLHGLSLVLAPIKAEEVAKLRQRFIGSHASETFSFPGIGIDDDESCPVAPLMRMKL